MFKPSPLGCSDILLMAPWVFVCGFFIATIAAILRICVPIQLNWNLSVKGTCGQDGTAELAAAGFNLALDVVIVLLPFPVIWGLHMSAQKKVAVMATFALSVL
jgi:hypothetical protein